MKKIIKNRKEFFVTNMFDYFWPLLETDQWEQPTFIVFDEFLDSKHSYIDIGAWIGPTVLYGAQVARYVYAVEPDPPAFQTLVQNIALNPDLKEKISVYNGCISDSNSKVRFGTRTTFGDSASSMLYAEDDNTITVSGITFDAFVEHYAITDCNFIKMDIEGGEMVVLPTMKEFLKKNRPTLYLSIHPFMCKNKNVFADTIVDSLDFYKNIFTDGGIGLRPEELYAVISEALTENGIYSIVATDAKNRCQNRLLRRYKLEIAQDAEKNIEKKEVLIH